MSYTNIILFRFDSFGNIVYQSPNTLNPGSIGQGLLRVQVPFDDTTYTGDVTWSLGNGQSVAQTFDTVSQVTVDEVLYYQWDKPIDDTINVVSANNSSVDLKFTARFTSSNQALTMEQGLISVTAGDTTGLSPIAPDEAADLSANKRARNPLSLTSKTTPDATDTFTMWGASEVAERSIGFEDLKNAINEDVVSSLVYTTGVDTGIADPVAGFSNFMKLVESTLDPDYPTTETTIDFTSTLVDTYEPITSSIYPLGFFNGSFLNLQFSNNFTLKTSSGTGTIKIDYYKIDDPDDLTGTLLGSTTITFTNTDYTLQSKGGVLAGPFTIDPNEGEQIVGRVYGKTSSAGISLSAQIGGAEPKTFTSWDIPSGAFSASKMNVILSPTVGNIIKVKADGNTEDAGISASDIQLISNKGVADGYASLDSGGKVPASQLPIDLVEIKGTFGSGSSTTGGDVPASAELGNTYICDTNGYISVNANDTFYINDKALWTDSGWIRNAANDSVLSVAGKTGVVVLDKNDVGLGNVENTADLDKPISTATQTELDKKLQYVGMLVDGVAVGANQFTKINVTSGGTLTQDGTDPNQVNWDILGAGTGEGTIVLGQAATIVPITVLTSNSDITFDEYRQSTDLTVFEVFENVDTPANTFRVYKTKTEIESDPVQYKFFLTGKGTNTNQTTEVNLSLRLFKDGVEVVNGDWPATATIGEASAQANASNNFTIESFVDTNILNAQEDYTLKINADATGVTLDKLDIHFTSNFVSGEALSNLMRTDTYDTGKLGRVDKAFADASGNEIETTYETIANVALKAPLASPAFTGDNTGIVQIQEGNNNTELKIWSGSQSEYDLLTPDANTIYYIEV